MPLLFAYNVKKYISIGVERSELDNVLFLKIKVTFKVAIHV
jgi:hypothetical protein